MGLKKAEDLGQLNIELKNGTFRVYNRETQENDCFPVVDGRLQSITIENDPGGGPVKPYDYVLMTLADEEGVYPVKITLKSQGAIGLAARLHAVQQGDYISLRAQGSEDNEKISFLSVRVGDNLELPERAVWATKAGGLDQDEQKYKAKQVIQAHDSYVAHEGEVIASAKKAEKAKVAADIEDIFADE
jgi:hypothetical protein